VAEGNTEVRWRVLAAVRLGARAEEGRVDKALRVINEERGGVLVPFSLVMGD
jgi:hypothetical protein